MESYDKLREIGKGSYGVVWLVKNKKDRKQYVLKRIDLRKSSERDKQSAEQEAKLLKSLKHPNIVSYKESFQVEGYLHIVMLYCDGGDLYTKIKEQNGKFIEEAQIVEWFVQIAMALQYMHEKYILHRDLKTQNIFLTKNKIIKVGDLGIARVLKSNNDMATTIIGTPYYMSPELFSNKPYNSKSDVWALGCCVYEMTTLKHAFNAKDMTSLVFKITKGKMPPIPSHYSKEFVALIESMLNADPKKRPTTSKILRDPFIKKNIMLFLERTKQKQQQMERESNTKIEPRAFIPERPSSRNQIQVVAQSEPMKSEFVNFNNFKAIQPQTPVKVSPQVQPRSSFESDLRIKKSDSNPEIEDRKQNKNSNFSLGDPRPKSVSDQKSKPHNRVRISSVVENIETKEFFSLADSSTLSAGDNLSDDEEHQAYELTKPMKMLNLNEAKPSLRQNLVEKTPEPEILHQPKIIERKPRIIDNQQPKVQERVLKPKPQSQSPTEEYESKSDTNISNSDSQSMQPNLSARERRRLKLRLSQNESQAESKPPLLKKLPIKSHQSEVFYNSDSKKNQSVSKPTGAVSKSLNDHERNKNNFQHPLEDSLKIFRKNQNSTPPVEAPKNSADLFKQQNKLERNPYFAKKQTTPSNNASQSSSSSSSIASSNEENDPGKELIRLEKRKKKDRKEMDNFIDKLSSTLKAAAADVSKNDSEVEDIKDEVLDDLEEEALQAEMSDSDDSNNGILPKKVDLASNRNERNANIFKIDDYSSKNNIKILRHRETKEKSDDYEASKLANVTLGATNHMFSRINSLEKECLELIGREKLDQVFRILDSFKDDEIEGRLISLIGRQMYKEYSGKLWLLKFCKETAKIGVR